MSARKSNPRDPLEKLKGYPAFQNLRAKAETWQLYHRPKETEALRRSGELDSMIDSRTMSAWNCLSDCIKNGMNLIEAQEIAYPLIYLESERDRPTHGDLQPEPENTPTSTAAPIGTFEELLKLDPRRVKNVRFEMPVLSSRKKGHIKPEEDARLDPLKARIESEWRQFRPSYVRLLQREGRLQQSVHETANRVRTPSSS